jgi:hypothetical protein
LGSPFHLSAGTGIHGIVQVKHGYRHPSHQQDQGPEIAEPFFVEVQTGNQYQVIDVKKGPVKQRIQVIMPEETAVPDAQGIDQVPWEDQQNDPGQDMEDNREPSFWFERWGHHTGFMF